MPPDDDAFGRRLGGGAGGKSSMGSRAPTSRFFDVLRSIRLCARLRPAVDTDEDEVWGMPDEPLFLDGKFRSKLLWRCSCAGAVLFLSWLFERTRNRLRGGETPGWRSFNSIGGRGTLGWEFTLVLRIGLTALLLWLLLLILLLLAPLL